MKTSGWKKGADLNAWTYLLFLLVLVQLPVELPHSVVPVPGLVITPLEVTLGLLALVWFLWISARRWAGWKPEAHRTKGWIGLGGMSWSLLRRPGLWILVWIVVLLISGLVAPEMRTHALKFTARSAAAALLYWISLTLHEPGPRGRQRSRTTLVALAAVGGVIAVLGALEPLGIAPLEAVMRLFRPLPTMIGPHPRVTATFPYANQTAAFLAMLLPLAAALALMRREVGSRIVWTGACGLIFWSLLGTLSRAGIVAGLLGVGLLVLLSWRRDLRNMRGRAALAGVLMLLAMVRVATDDGLRERVAGAPSGRIWSAGYEVPRLLIVRPGQTTQVPVDLTNRGSFTWRSAGVVPVHLANHLISLTGRQPLQIEGSRTPLPEVVEPGERIRLQARLQAPPREGAYIVAWDLVQERVTWFSSEANPVAFTRLVVSDPDSASRGIAALQSVPDSTVHATASRIPSSMRPDPLARRVLWERAVSLFLQRPLLGWGGDTFRLLYARALGPGEWDPRLHANNMYLELLADCGILGLAVWLSFGLSMLLAVRRIVIRSGERDERIAVAGGVAALAAFAAHGMLDSFLEFYGIMGLFWILAGALASYGSDRARECRPDHEPRESGSRPHGSAARGEVGG